MIEIHTQSYPDARTQAERIHSRLHNSLGALNRLLLAERDGRIVGHAFGFELRYGFGGKLVPALGVAGVGVAPEARGYGVGGDLMRALHANAATSGAALSVLYPYRQGFYARLGYASATPTLRYVVDPHALLSKSVRPKSVLPETGVPNAQKPQAKPPEDRISLRAASGEDFLKMRTLRSAEVLAGYGSFERPEALWEKLICDPRRYFVVATEGSDIVGYVATKYTELEPLGEAHLHVEELLAPNPEVHRAFCTYLGQQRAQIAQVHFTLPWASSFDRTLLDADRHRSAGNGEHVLGSVLAGPMVHVLSWPRALAARGYFDHGTLLIRLYDTDQTFELTATSAGVQVRGVDGAAAQAAAGRIELTSAECTQLFFGGRLASEVQRPELPQCAQDAWSQLARMLGTQRFFSSDNF